MVELSTGFIFFGEVQVRTSVQANFGKFHGCHDRSRFKRFDITRSVVKEYTCVLPHDRLGMYRDISSMRWIEPLKRWVNGRTDHNIDVRCQRGMNWSCGALVIVGPRRHWSTFLTVVLPRAPSSQPRS